MTVRPARRSSLPFSRLRADTVGVLTERFVGWRGAAVEQRASPPPTGRTAPQGG